MFLAFPTHLSASVPRCRSKSPAHQTAAPSFSFRSFERLKTGGLRNLFRRSLDTSLLHLTNSRNEQEKTVQTSSSECLRRAHDCFLVLLDKTRTSYFPEHAEHLFVLPLKQKQRIKRTAAAPSAAPGCFVRGPCKALA